MLPLPPTPPLSPLIGAGVLRLASSTSVQLRLPLPPWPAWTNQSRPQGVSILSVTFLTSFCIEIEPSEQVVWLWKSPVTYLPGALPAAPARVGATPTETDPMAAKAARATSRGVNLKRMKSSPGGCVVSASQAKERS